MALNYIREINAFYDWLETNSISNSAIVLWHALMHINNKAGWITEFTVAISTLETKTGLKKDAVLRARNRLQQVGRIAFKSRQGQQSAIYSIIPFLDSSSGCVVLNDTNRNTNRNTNRELTATLTATQTASINKLNINETKQKDINPPKEKPDKIAVSEFVYLTPAEHERLLNEFGEADTSRMIEILDNYIGQNPKRNNRYTDHNRVIRGWVKDRLLEEKRKLGKVAQFKPRTNNHREEESDFDWGWTKT